MRSLSDQRTKMLSIPETDTGSLQMVIFTVSFTHHITLHVQSAELEEVVRIFKLQQDPLQ